MKKKVLSVLLAAALFAGTAVSVSAATWGDWDVSSQSADNGDITKLEFDASSYTIENGKSEDLHKKLTAYAGTKAIAQEPELDWAISDNDLIFGLETNNNEATVYAYENKGTATVTVTANDGKVKATCKVVASSMAKATGFKFEKTSYKVPVTDTDPANDYTINQDIKLVPTPTDAKFSERQKTDMAGYTIELVATKDYDAKTVGGVYLPAVSKGDVLATANWKESANDGATYTFPKSALNQRAISSAKLVVKEGGSENITFPAYDSDKDDKKTSRDVKASTEAAKPAVRAGRTGSVTLEVGQVKDLDDFVKFGPTDYNVKKDGTGTDDTSDNQTDLLSNFSIEYYNDSANVDDYAVVNGDNEVLGVAVGKVKAVATFNPIGRDSFEIEIPINIVAKGTIVNENDAALAATSGALTVGGTYWLEVKNAPSDAEKIEWTVDNDVATIVPETGAAVKVFAKKTGTAKITATYNGEEIGTFTLTVNAKGPETPNQPTTPVVPNPGTGDSLFANLF